jgi:hypothetical protein
MEWFKKHTDAVMIIGAIAASMIWMNGKFNEIEKDIAVMKAVLVMKNIMPTELAIVGAKENL